MRSLLALAMLCVLGAAHAGEPPVLPTGAGDCPSTQPEESLENTGNASRENAPGDTGATPRHASPEADANRTRSQQAPSSSRWHSLVPGMIR